MRTVLKKIVYLLYYLFYSRIQGIDGELLVVTYHRISEKVDPTDPLKISVSTFEQQVQFLKQTFSVISAQSLSDAIGGIRPLPHKACLITFDDGWQDNYTLAFPVLRKYGLPALIFVSTDYISTSNVFWQAELRYILTREGNGAQFVENADRYWPGELAERVRSVLNLPRRRRDESVNDLIERLKALSLPNIKKVVSASVSACSNKSAMDGAMLTWEQVSEMMDHGIGFGSHAKSHAILTQLNEDNLRDEIAGSKKVLEEKLFCPIHFMAYPNGDYDECTMRVAKEAGFRGCFTCRPGLNQSLVSRFELRRINMRENSAFGFGTDFSPLFYKVELSGVRFHLKELLKCRQ